MIRSLAILLLILTSALAAIPSTSQSYANSPTSSTNTGIIPIADPINGTRTAFNYTYSQANLYTTASATSPREFPASNFTGISNTYLSSVHRTLDNSTIPNTGFRFSLTSANLTQGKEEVNWTLTIPQFNCVGCSSVSVTFNFFGNLTRGTNATYTLSPLSPPNSTIIPGGRGSYTTVGAFPSNPTMGCPEDICIDVTKYRGYNVTLSFSFGWTFSNETLGMFAEVGEVVVASIGSFIPSSSNFMQQDPSDSSLIRHTTDLFGINYNSTLTTYVQPGNMSRPKLWWQIEVISIYYPAGYQIKQVSLNGTLISPSLPKVPFETEKCVVGTSCSQSLIALNMTDFRITSLNSTITIISSTANSISQLSTLSGGLATQFFTSGDQLSVKVANQPSIVNASTSLQTGTLTITFPSALLIPPGLVSTATGGIYDFALPSDCGTSGLLCARSWSFFAVFTSGFDLGNATGSFRIDSLQVSFNGSTGGSNSLTVKGRLTYGNGTMASGVNATLFAIDRGTPVNRPVTYDQTIISPTTLYVSNVTLVNGVFTRDQPLILLFTIVNPDLSKPYNATVTIEHEWPGPQAHGMSVTFSLNPGDRLSDLPFNATGPQTYKATILFTGTGVQVTLTNLRTFSNSMNGTMTPGTSPVVPNRPHAGLFNIILTSILNNNPQTPTNSILSPLYAYVPSSLAPSRYLSPSNVIQTDSNGDFSATISSNFLLGAKNMTVLLLARDATGIGLVNNLSTIGLTDSTILISTTDSIAAVAKDQTVTTTLHVKSNSTKITEVITVNLILQGSGMPPETKATRTDLTIGPGESKTVTLTFTAPSTIGSYTLTFSSPEYGGPLTSQTLHVAIVQSNLQILIPAAIGVVAAIIVLGVYLIRGKPVEEGGEKTKTKPAAGSTKTRPASANPPSKSLTRTRGTKE